MLLDSIPLGALKNPKYLAGPPVTKGYGAVLSINNQPLSKIAPEPYVLEPPPVMGLELDSNKLRSLRYQKQRK
jgi:hypothetical protein